MKKLTSRLWVLRVCGKGVHTVLSRHEAFGLHQTVRPWACVLLQGRGKGQTRCGSPD